MTIFDIFEATVDRFGDRVAVEVQRADGLDRFTYRDLHAMALDRAARLDDHNVRRGDRCAILADNDAHWCAAYFGILARGAIVVPLDTNYSAAQVATIVADSGARVLFANTRLRDVARQALSAFPGVVLVDVHEPFEEGPDRDVESADPFDAALILYTSGTTSDPKGVVLTHANLIAERDAVFQVVDVSEADALLGVLPLFHSLAQVANLLLPFAVGARVVYLETLSSQELVRALSERKITIFCCVPQFFYLIHQRVMGEVTRRGAVARTVFRTLLAVNFRLRRMGVNLGPQLFGRVHDTMGRQMRLFVTGGSKFDPAVGRDLYALGFTILQAYGLTETSGAATINTPHEAHIDTVGRPIPGVEAKLMDDGEIALRGPIVMKEYFGRPDATAAAMRDGWFLTGDLGRIDADGRVAITGRKKEMIVLANGKNIYPEEIEAHYRQSAYVKEICVSGLVDEARLTTEQLYAVVVPNLDLMRERKMVNAGDILRFEIEGLSASLPAYKRVLGYDISFEPLARTTTGKLKRHEIARQLIERRKTASNETALLTDDDEAWLADAGIADAVAIVRARVRRPGRVAPDANLELDLGLDSMERVELLTELEQHFGQRVPDQRGHEIFTVRQLIDAVRGGEASAAPAAAEPSWSVLLRNLPPDSDPVLGGLLEPRSVLKRVLFTAGRVLPRLFARLEVRGRQHLPASGPFILCPNHQSCVDPFFVCGSVPYRVFAELFFVGAVEYFETPLMRWVARKVNCVPVDPDSNLVPAMKAGAFGLTHRKILMLFPEGERSIDGTVKRFKKGAPILAQHLGVPIVPVAITGAYEVWPRNRPLNWLGSLARRHKVRVSFGEPMQFSENETAAEAADRLRAAVNALWSTG